MWPLGFTHVIPTPSSPPSSGRRKTRGRLVPRFRQRLRESSFCFPAGSVPYEHHYPLLPATARPATASALYSLGCSSHRESQVQLELAFSLAPSRWRPPKQSRLHKERDY